jgi:lysophospholipid acyltransferase (LPLAT)-like uncharacterized protein
MQERLKSIWKKVLLKLKIFAMIFIGKNLLHLLIKTCRIQVEGLEHFCDLASKKEKCMLMLWHNRLIIIPCILSRYAPCFLYAALVSAHRDGDILSSIIHSYPQGNTIRSSPKAGYKALRDLVHHVEEGKQIVIITPDGPRGPLYEVKPGIAVAALETQAHVIALNWEAEKFFKSKRGIASEFLNPLRKFALYFLLLFALTLRNRSL